MRRRAAPVSVAFAAVLAVAGVATVAVLTLGPTTTSAARTRPVVPKLTRLWTAALAGPGTAPTVAGGEVFVTAIRARIPLGSKVAGSDLYAYGATCPPAPAGCGKSLTWVHPYPAVQAGQAMDPAELTPTAVGDGHVYVGWNQEGADQYDGQIDAFDTATGAPAFSGGQGGTSTPAEADGVVASNWQYQCCMGLYSGSGTESIDASTGARLFVTDPGYGDPSSPPSVGAGTLFVAQGGYLEAYDATGKECALPPLMTPAEYQYYLSVSGFPEICAPLWYAAPAGGPILASVTVAGDEAYVGSSGGDLYAFPAAGCGSPACNPDWTGIAGGPITTAVAVNATTVFAVTSNGQLSAFPLVGCGSPTCAPEWTATVGGVPSTPAVAGPLVYVTSTDQLLEAFPVAGCGGTVCGPSWQATLHAPSDTAPAVGNGLVFVTNENHALYAYRQP